MIKCNFGTVSIEGIKSVIKAELSTLIFTLIQDDVLTVEDIQKCVDLAILALNKTPQELENISDELTDKLKKILEILEG